MTKREVTQDKKVQILEATTELLKTQGLQALSFEGVASQAGLSRQLVRYYFTDLDTLMVELCEHLGSTYLKILVAGIVEVQLVERLDFFLDFFFDLLSEHPMPDNLAAYDALVAYAVGSQPFKDRLCNQYKTLGQVIEHELAIAHPQLSSAACSELSFMFVSMMHAHWSFVASLGFSRAHSQLARQAVGRLIASYIQDPGPPVLDRPWGQD